MRLFLFLAFAALVIALALYYVHVNPAQNQDASAQTSDPSDLELGIDQPQQIYQLMMRNTRSEIRLLAWLLGIVFLLAIVSARLQIVVGFVRQQQQELFARMFQKWPRSEDQVKARLLGQSADSPRYQRTLLDAWRRHLDREDHHRRKKK